MEMEELKGLWARSEDRLEASMRLNTLLLQQTNLQRAAASLRRLSLGVLAELAVNLVAVVLLGSFAADHVREPRFLVPAIALGIYAIALLAAGVRQIVDIWSVDYDEPVVALQKKLEELRVRRIRTTLWTLLFAPLMWVPLLIVALRGFFGVDLYAVADAGWLVANGLLGVAVIPLATFAARRYGQRLARFGFIRTLADDIAGRSLARALDALDAIRRFEEAA
jgi:hypothetical protein